MLSKNLFKKPKNDLESYDKYTKSPAPDIPSELCISCPECKAMLFTSELNDHLHVCPKCGHHFRVNARQRISLIADEDSFEEHDAGMRSRNLIGFPNYDRKLKHAYLDSAEKEGVVCGTARIGGMKCCLFVMEPYFMMGSMGQVVGDKITRIIELATKRKLPLLISCTSGGARMQEGIMSLMQMAKTSAALKRFSDEGGFYISLLTHPTTGGVSASFAMLGDIIIAEPNALVGFAGKRVIENTINETLPKEFQRAEFLLEKGFIDMIVKRTDMKKTIYDLIVLHKGVKQ